MGSRTTSSKLLFSGRPLRRKLDLLPGEPVRLRAHVVQGIAAVVLLCCAVLGIQQGLEAGVLSTGYDREVVHPAAACLDEAIDELICKSYDVLARMNGDSRTIAQEGSDEAWRLDLKVSRSGLGLIEIQGVVVEAGSGREVDRLKTYRTR
ncbi:MAG: hypothetical protein R3F30_08810 [Planctomycetota bacterium]